MIATELIASLPGLLHYVPFPALPTASLRLQHSTGVTHDHLGVAFDGVLEGVRPGQIICPVLGLVGLLENPRYLVRTLFVLGQCADLPLCGRRSRIHSLLRLIASDNRSGALAAQVFYMLFL